MENDTHQERIIHKTDVTIVTSRSDKSSDIEVEIDIEGNRYAAYRIVDVCNGCDENAGIHEMNVIRDAFIDAIDASDGIHQSRFAASVNRLARAALNRNGYADDDVIQTLTPVSLNESIMKRLKTLMPMSHVGESSFDKLLAVYAFCDAISPYADSFDTDMQLLLSKVHENVPDAVRLLAEVKIKSAVDDDAVSDIMQFRKVCTDIVQLRLLRDVNARHGDIMRDIAVDFTCGAYGFPFRIKMISSMIYECVDTVVGVLTQELKPFAGCENETVSKIIREQLELLRYH